MLVSMMGNFTYSNSMISTHHHTSLTNWVWSLFRTSHHHNNNHFPQKLLKRIDISNSQLSSSFPPPPPQKKSLIPLASSTSHDFSAVSVTPFPVAICLFFLPLAGFFQIGARFPRWSHIPTPLTTVDKITTVLTVKAWCCKTPKKKQKKHIHL